ncbi:MAG: transcription elongation factor GreA, partial [candidate division WOR-3 bacterium]
GYAEPIGKALADFDLHGSLPPGAQVYSDMYGPGSVTNIDLLLDRLTVRWHSGTETTLDIAAAGRQIRVLPPDGFFSLLKKAPSELSRLCTTDPGKAVALFLRDIGRQVSVSDIRAALGQLVPDTDWHWFWEKARRFLATNPNIRVVTSPSRSYFWQDEPATLPQESVSEQPRVRRTVSDVNRLKTLAPDEIASEYETLTTAISRRQLLERIRIARPEDWKNIYATVFRIGRDDRSRELIESSLIAEDPSLWQKTVETTLTGYRQSPEAFAWLLTNADRFPSISPRGLISRALDLLESSAYRHHWNHLRRALAAGDYRLIARTIDEIELDDARRLLERIRNCHNLEEFRRQRLTGMFAAHFPQLAEADDSVIWSTATGIEKARTELRNLTERELPAVAEELARARSHGDLSENYEYKAAREKQNRLMVRVNRLRQELSRARVIEPDSVDTSTVSPGCRVVLRDLAGNEQVYTILGPWDADPDHGIISHQSPLAKQLLGLKRGDTVNTDSGSLQVTAITLGMSV